MYAGLRRAYRRGGCSSEEVNPEDPIAKKVIATPHTLWGTGNP